MLKAAQRLLATRRQDSGSHVTHYADSAIRTGQRPEISVVIPTYEPQHFLIDAVRSVLTQDRGERPIQIAIVDDGSTRRRPATLLAGVAPAGRIEFYEHADNLGLAGNWNRAIARAQGEFIHILHQDDIVRPGFYARLVAGLRNSPRAGMAFCRHAFVDENDSIDRVSHRERWRAGVLPHWLRYIAVSQRIQCPAAIVRRDVYERLGGFRHELRYTLDWEMWVRIAAHYDVWYEPRVLAHYRRHDAAESARLEATNLVNTDLMNAIEILATHLPPSCRNRLKDRAYRRLARSQLRRASKLLKSRLPHRAAAQIDCARAALDRLPDGLARRWLTARLMRLDERLPSPVSQPRHYPQG